MTCFPRVNASDRQAHREDGSGPKIWRNLTTSFASCLRPNSCSQICGIRQPAVGRARFTFRSRASFVASFFRQNAVLLRGFVA